jgi:hypothetical protein
VFGVAETKVLGKIHREASGRKGKRWSILRL